MSYPVCSVLLATRRRVASLNAAIDSFLQTADNPANVEVIVRVHDDDADSLEWARTRPPGIRVIIGDTDDGYGSGSDRVNCMAAVSKGDWLWAAADDGRVRTRGWDTILAQRLAEPRHDCLMLWSTVPPDSQLCVMSRGWYRAIGHFGMTEHGDTYAFSLARIAGLLETVAIDYAHLHLPLVAARNRPKTWDEFRSAEVARCFNTDKLKLGAVLGRPIHDPWTPSMEPDGINVTDPLIQA